MRERLAISSPKLTAYRLLLTAYLQLPMKTPETLDTPSNRIQALRLPTTLRAAVAGVLLASLPVQASGPHEHEEGPTQVAIMDVKKRPIQPQPKTDPFEEGLKEIRQANGEAQVKKLWLSLAQNHPVRILECPELANSPFMMETLDVACGALAAKQPEIFLEKAIACTDDPNYRLLVGTAAKNASVTKPEAAVRFKDLYVDLVPEGQKTFKNATENIRKKTAKVIPKSSSTTPQPAYPSR